MPMYDVRGTMKTCATCEHYETHDGHCKRHDFYLAEGGKDILVCAKYDPKKDPIRLECECEWVQESDGDSVFYRPSADGIFDMLHKFSNRRTRMVLEEIL